MNIETGELSSVTPEREAEIHELVARWTKTLGERFLQSYRSKKPLKIVHLDKFKTFKYDIEGVDYIYIDVRTDPVTVTNENKHADFVFSLTLEEFKNVIKATA